MSGRSGRVMLANSCSATTVAAAASPNSHQPPSQTSPSTTGSPTIATRIRDQNALTARRSATAETAPSPRVGGQRLVQVALAEVGPEAVDEDELGVGELPEQEVRHAELARGADHEVRVGHVRRVQVGRE